MIVMSFQDFKLCGKQISPTFPYFLINNAVLYHFLANLLAHNKKNEKHLLKILTGERLTSLQFAKHG